MRLYHLLHLPLSTSLVIVTGGCFAVLCLLILLMEFLAKIIAIPIIFAFGTGCLAYGLVKRKVFKFKTA
jgi:hypothetical protein